MNKTATPNQVNPFVVIAVVIVLYLLYRRTRGRPSTAFGTARWMDEATMRSVGMLAGKGLVLGRSMKGKLLCLPSYCHILLIGSPGSGKGVGSLIPNLMRYVKGSVVCFDCKGDLHATTAKRRQQLGQKVERFAPFNGGTTTINPLDLIPKDSPTLVDSARAMAEALVARQGTEHDPHWNDKSVQVITAILVLLLLKADDENRSLNGLQDIASDRELLYMTAHNLREIDGIPARLGSQLLTLFEHGQVALTKEGAGVVSTVARHLAFLDSPLVAKAVAKTSFAVTDLLQPGTTLYLQIPTDQLEAQRSLLRCIVSTLVRLIGKTGDENKAEVLFLLDEASALGSLSAVEEALVRGRSAGVRLLLVYQSDSQVKTAFKDKKTLLYDTCSTQIYLGASSYETAERISKSLGEYTQVVNSYGENTSRSYQEHRYEGNQHSRGSSTNVSQAGRALLKPEEILCLSDSYLIAFLRGMPPILAKRVRWYSDPAFNPAAKCKRFRFSWIKDRRFWWVVLALVAGLYFLVKR